MDKLQTIIKEGELKDYSKLHTNVFTISSSIIYDNWLKRGFALVYEGV